MASPLEAPRPLPTTPESQAVTPQAEATTAYEFPFDKFPTPKWALVEFTKKSFRAVIEEEGDGKHGKYFDFDFNLELDPRNPKHLDFARTVLGKYGAQMAHDHSDEPNLDIIRIGPPLEKPRLQYEWETLVASGEMPYLEGIPLIGVYRDTFNYSPVPGYDPTYRAELHQSVEDFLAKESS